MNTPRYLIVSLILPFVADAFLLADEKSDAAALSALNEAYVGAFNRHEAAAVAQFFAEDADLLMLTGDLLEGRERIAQGHAAFFANNPQAKLSGKQTQRRFLTPEIALTRGEWSVTNGPSEFPSKGLWSAVQFKQKGTWRYASLSLIIPVAGK